MCVCVCPTCVCPDVLDVVALAVGEVGALAAGVQFAGEVVPQVFPPVVLAHGGVGTQSALEHPAETQQTLINSVTVVLNVRRNHLSNIYKHISLSVLTVGCVGPAIDQFLYLFMRSAD